MVSYDDSPIDIDEDIVASHVAVWNRLGRPGPWFSGEERLFIAAETRRAPTCRLCLERRDALSPEHVDGEHDCGDEMLLSPKRTIVDVIHRVRNDSGRLSRAWFERMTKQGELEEAAYVEVIAVLVQVVAVDTLCHALGLPLFELPAPTDGGPTRQKPSNVTSGEAWVPMIPAGTRTGAGSDLFSNPQVPTIGRALSVALEDTRTVHQLVSAHYVPTHQVIDTSISRTLSRPQMELIAARVSAVNGCFY